MSNKRSYSYVELWKRQEIIDTYINKNESVKKCALRLGVKYITAKHIVKVFKRTGRIETKLMSKARKDSDNCSVSEKSMSNCDNFNDSARFCNNATQYCSDKTIPEMPMSSCDTSTIAMTPRMGYMEPQYDPNYCVFMMPNMGEMYPQQAYAPNMMAYEPMMAPVQYPAMPMYNNPVHPVSQFLGNRLFNM